MKLLMTTDTLGGVWHYAMSLCAALAPHHVEIVLAVMGRPSPAQRTAAAALGHVTVAEGDHRLEWMPGSKADMAESGRWLVALARRHKVDLVHINGYAHAALPFGRPVIAVAHSDVVSWYAAVKGQAAPEDWDHYRGEAKHGLDRASVVVTPTEAVRCDLARHFGLTRPSQVIPNGLSLANYRPRPKRPVVMSVGRIWDEAKNVAALDRAAAGLPWPIEVAGDARHPDGGAAAPGNLTLLGTLPPPEIASRLGEAAIYAAPAFYEPFGLAILEAAASGCALVLGDIPSLRENWTDAASFAPPGDGDALLARLSDLIASPDLCESWGNKALKRAKAFPVERMAGDYAALYLSLMHQPVMADA